MNGKQILKEEISDLKTCTSQALNSVKNKTKRRKNITFQSLGVLQNTVENLFQLGIEKTQTMKHNKTKHILGQEVTLRQSLKS